MKKIIFATTNEGKMIEIREALMDLDVEIYSLNDLDLDIDIKEDGSTFEENAIIKARRIMEVTGEFVMADDSGLEVDYLGKAPGVHSSRYLGEDTSYDIKNNYIIDKLADAVAEERSARFVCAIAFISPNGELISRTGTMEGYIADEIKGDEGFGYDPIFYVPEFESTTAQMTIEEKNKISHRGKALREIKTVLKDKYGKLGE